MVMDSANKKLYLFAGSGLASKGTADVLNDLWRWDLVAARWTWLSGSSSTLQPGVYGQQGVAADGNAPGARYYSSIVTDERTGLLYVFGGLGMDETGTQVSF